MSRNKILTLLLTALSTVTLSLWSQPIAAQDSLTTVASIDSLITPASGDVSTSLLPPARPATPSTLLRAGSLSYDSLLHSLPQYIEARESLARLRGQYEREAEYNEDTFHQQFTDFLERQRDFPTNILLKRQRDLQESLERGVSFRHSADSLLRAAEAEMLAPIRARLDEAIRLTALERGYAFVVNLDGNAFPFVQPMYIEDATPYVLSRLGRMPDPAVTTH